MKIIGLVTLIFGLALVQSLLIPLNWLLLLVLFLALDGEAKESLIWAFIAGLVADLVFGQRLGLSSLIFLSLVLATIWAKEKLVTFQLSLVFLAGFLAELLYHYLLFRNWFWGRGLFFGLVLVLISTRAKKQVSGLKISW